MLQRRCPFLSLSVTRIHSIFQKHAFGAFLFSLSLPLGRFNVVYAVFVCDHTTGCEACSFMTDGYMGFVTHEGGSGTNTSAQELTQRDRKTLFTLPGQGIEPRVLGFEFRRFGH